MKLDERVEFRLDTKTKRLLQELAYRKGQNPWARRSGNYSSESWGPPKGGGSRRLPRSSSASGVKTSPEELGEEIYRVLGCK
jgi:hypothetical protein